MSLFVAENLDVSYDAMADTAAVDAEAYRGAPSIRLRDINFALEAGRIYDLVGPSGNGKSMLFRACALMMQRQGGTLLLDGKLDSSFASTEWRRNVCLVPQQAALVPGTIRDNLVLPWTLKINKGLQKPSDDELRDILVAANLEVDLERDAAKLSGGQAARVALIRVLVTHPQVILLDEVDAALDDESSQAISRLTVQAAERGSACLRIRHRASDGLASETFRLQDGRLTKVSATGDSKEVR